MMPFRSIAALVCALLLGVLMTRHVFAQDAKPLKGVALVIGQSEYETLPPLPNAERDARQIEELLAKLGFATDLASDEKARKLRRSVDGFIEDAEDADVALLYYSGHGIEAGGENYLIPTDAGLTSLDAADENFVSVQDILERLQGKARITILLLDACRSNPFPKDALVRRSAASAGAPISVTGLGQPRGALVIESSGSPDSIGEVIGFAAEPGKAALDGPSGTNSPYATALLKHLAANTGYDFGQVMTMVTEEVYLATGTRQRPWTNTSLRRFLSFGGTVEEASADDTLLAGERRKLLLTIAATPQETRTAVEALAKDQSLPLDPLYGMLKELEVDVAAGPEELDKQLRAGAENLRKLLAEKVVPLRKDPELIRLAGLGDRAQAQGAIALAKDYRAKAASRADELDKTLDQREAEVNADRIELASTYADYGDTAVLAFDYRTAAEQYRKAFEQVDGREAALAFKYRLREADALVNHGDHKGDNAALRQSLELYEQAREIAEHAKARDDWAIVQNNLGVALGALGQREGDASTLLKAVAAYEAALTVRSREQNPQAWAETENNLGTALSAVGQREKGTASLEKAITAYEAVLTVWTRESSSLYWAMVQNNLSQTLRLLGQRESGTETLNKAVTASESALSARTRETAPLGWAMAQNNLGEALRVLGDRETGTVSLKKAVAAYEAALTQMTRDRVPLKWAALQNNVGAALQAIGQRESGTQSLTRSIAAYEAALTELTRERAPLDWAHIQSNLGVVLRTLAERERDTAALRKAIEAYKAALGELTRERVPLDWAATQNNMGLALHLFGELTDDAAYFDKAITAYDAALTVRTRADTPIDWAGSQNNLGFALQALGERESGTISLTRAVKAFEAALDVFTRDRAAMDWAATQNNLGLALRKLGERENDPEKLRKALSAYEAVLGEWTPERAPLNWAMAQNNLGSTKLALGTLTKDKAMIDGGKQAVAAAWEAYKAAGQGFYDDYFRDRLAEFDAAMATLSP
ncbi:MAG: caspase family protein [Parvibaculaceae bacterium]